MFYEKVIVYEREFIMEVIVGQYKVTGVGFNKKEVKKKVVEVMLQLIGFRFIEGQLVVKNLQVKYIVLVWYIYFIMFFFVIF